VYNLEVSNADLYLKIQRYIICLTRTNFLVLETKIYQAQQQPDGSIHADGKIYYMTEDEFYTE